MHIPLSLIYAGLIGSVAALLVATAQQKWQWRVFFILALRLAIGWHFLFEGMHKIHSHYVGVVPESNQKPFSAEAYFRESEGPLSPLFKRYFLADPEKAVYDLVRPAKNPTTVADLIGEAGVAALRADFARPGSAQTVGHIYAPVPEAGQADLPKFYADAVLALPLNGPGLKFLFDYPAQSGARKAIDDAIREQMPAAADARYDEIAGRIRPLINGENEAKRLEVFERVLTTLKGGYARWAVGVESREGKKKYISGEIAQSVPARLADYEHRKRDLAELETRRDANLGRSSLFTKVAATRADLKTLRDDLTKDAESFFTEALTELAKAAEVKPDDIPKPPAAKPKLVDRLDQITMWTLTAAGACLIIGLGTRAAAVTAAGFLAMTYLIYPPFPWLPNPPGTEGNPVFVNKNLVEMLALCAIAAMPTGRWLGVDALLARLIFGRAKRAI